MSGRISSEPEPGEPPPLLVTLDAACRMLGVGRTKLRELVAAGSVESVHIGQRHLFPVDSLERYVATLRANGGPRPHLSRAES